MTIEKEKNGDQLIIKLIGRMDTTTAPQLNVVVDTELDDVKDLVMDFAELDYISSAGLRVLLIAQKKMNKQGSLVIKHPNETIMEIFDISGFGSILTVQQ